MDVKDLLERLPLDILVSRSLLSASRLPTFASFAGLSGWSSLDCIDYICS